MAPKGGSQPSKKTETKAKAKIIEDRTFGLKNKNKSAKVNKYVESVKAQVESSGDRKLKKLEEAKAALRKQKKEEEEARKTELALISKPVVQQKVPFGTDPKSVLCQYFKISQCSKGDKCKFSHDLNVERKSAKIDLYTDVRDLDRDKEAKELDTMDTWDQQKLETVVSSKHGHGVKTTTDIVCKYFLDAIEQRKYGWFWECPNGGTSCKYRHALPPGYVFKPKATNAPLEEDEESAISLEEFLETERHQLKGTLTPVTETSFLKWKADRLKRLADENSALAKKKEADVKAGRALASGRELFVANPELFQLDDDEAMEEEQLLDREEGLYSDDSKKENDEKIDIIEEDLFLEEDLDALKVDDDEDDNDGSENLDVDDDDDDDRNSPDES